MSEVKVEKIQKANETPSKAFQFIDLTATIKKLSKSVKDKDEVTYKESVETLKANFKSLYKSTYVDVVETRGSKGELYSLGLVVKDIVFKRGNDEITFWDASLKSKPAIFIRRDNMATYESRKQFLKYYNVVR